MNSTIWEKFYPALARDYILGRKKARSFFQFEPDMEGIVKCLHARNGTSVSQRLYTILKRQNREHGASKKTMENIEHLKDPQCPVVITGQQIGLFGGSLYVTFKICKAVHTAESLQTRIGRPVVPVFWTGTNDHDFEEIRNISFVDDSGTLRTVSYSGEHTRNMSCGRIPVDTSIESVIDRCFEKMRDTEFTPEVRRILSESYSEGSSLGSSFFKLAACLYSRMGIVILDPSDPEFVDLIRPVLMKECTELASVSPNLFADAAESVSRLGYHVQVKPEQGRLHAFVSDKGVRKALFFRDGKVVDRQGNSVDVSRADLSTHVLSRNICQDLVFNTAAYIAGPGEISYCALLKKIYKAHGVVMPVILPRYMGTLVDKPIQRSLDALDIGPEHFILKPKDRAVHEIFSSESDVDIDRLEKDLNKLADRFTGSVEKHLPVGKGSGSVSSLNKMIKSKLAMMIGNVRKRKKEQVSSVLHRASYASGMLLPGGKLQERVVNILQFMNFYGGTGFIDTLSDLVRDSEEGHIVWKI